MDLQVPMALQVALYAATGCLIVLTFGILVGLLVIKKRIDQVVRSVENLEAILEPLLKETRVAVQNLQELTGRIHDKWLAMESLLETARGWGRVAARVVEQSTAMVTSPILAVNRTTKSVMKGVQTFFQVLLSRTP